MVKVLFFAQLREALDCRQLEYDLQESLTVEQLIEKLSQNGEIWQQHLKTGRLMMAINQELVSKETLIKDRDEVALFPPVTGG